MKRKKITRLTATEKILHGRMKLAKLSCNLFLRATAVLSVPRGPKGSCFIRGGARDGEIQATLQVDGDWDLMVAAAKARVVVLKSLGICLKARVLSSQIDNDLPVITVAAPPFFAALTKRLRTRKGRPLV